MQCELVQAHLFVGLHIVGSVLSDSHVTSSERDAGTIQLRQQQLAAKFGSGVYDEVDEFCQQSAASNSNGIANNNDYDEIGDVGPENSYAHTYLALVPDKDCCEDDCHVTVL